MGKMEIIDHTGHTTVTWDIQVEEEIIIARDKFEELLRGGRVAYTDEGMVREFDPQIEEMTVRCLMAGG